MRPFHVEINTYGRIFKELDPAHTGTYFSSWHKTLEDAEGEIFKRTHNLNREIMAYKATISEAGSVVAFWTDDVEEMK
jgi:hypothetical protein